MFQERADGADAVAWAARQPWSSGKVGGFGGSYLGNTQWLAAAEAPPELLALAPTVTWSDFYAGMQYEGGANYMHGLWWSLGMVEEEVRRRLASGQAVPEGMPQGDPTDHLPLSDLPALRELAPHYFAWLAHPTAGPYWRGASPDPAWKVDGSNLLDVWTGKKNAPERTVFWEYHVGGVQMLAAMRGDFKLLDIAGQQFLYNVEADPGERRNLNAQYPDVMKQLTAELKAWFSTEVKR
jgi:hypothetical protein